MEVGYFIFPFHDNKWWMHILSLKKDGKAPELPHDPCLIFQVLEAILCQQNYSLKILAPTLALMAHS